MQKGAFVQVHVSGLPHVCSDSDVEAELRRAVIGAPVVTSQSAPGYLAVESCDIEEPTADAQAAGSPVVVEAVAADLAAAADPVTIPLADGASACEGLPTVSDGGEDSPIADEELRLLAAFVTCVVVRNKDTQECKGYCFLTFETASEAERAIDVLNSGVDIVGARVSAQISLPKERHAKPKDPSQDIGDLRLRRARYQCLARKLSTAIWIQVTVRRSTRLRRQSGRIETRLGDRICSPARVAASHWCWTRARDQRGWLRQFP